jgi:hemerythrin-like domain-containing protein
MNDHKLIVADFELAKATQTTHDGNLTESPLIARLTHSMNDHFSKEERVLFPLLGRFLGSNICDKLRGEHTEMMRIASQPNDEVLLRKEPFDHLGDLLRAHFATEENVIFWYLDVRRLTEQTITD